MHNFLLKQVKDFLKLHWQPQSPVLIACSGGPDSKALLYLLLKCRPFFPLDIHVAHVDHGWRKESLKEAQALKEEVESLRLPFHLKSLKKLPLQEEAAREARYSFLTEVSSQIKAQAIALGHQREDQAETVLKRVLEGASLPACGGMKPLSFQKNTPLWRPLLNLAKKDLLEWLNKQAIAYFLDYTNLQEKYLRGRLRTSILPLLEKHFGKSIVKNLHQLGERAQQMEAFLTNQIEPLWKAIEKKDQGYSLDLKHIKPLDDVVVDFFLKEWAKKEGVHLSREQIIALRDRARSNKLLKGHHSIPQQITLAQGKLNIE